ncbi:type IV secretory system conjugative DNA transfer family protein [Nitrosospira multiformis]|uniref:type IV secretory system conjugative DNA transfer family protein n=1 Tax=Nitrosospira multiformis TaxID=1231 RepID=UPI0009425411|nr:type IV secretory system conjugative DNA transfer family protein [Nitrosospira multiformis]
MRHTSRTLQEVQRSLLAVDECLRMPGPVKGGERRARSDRERGRYDHLRCGFPAIYGRQPLYFQDAIFQKRAEVPAPVTSSWLTNLVE